MKGGAKISMRTGAQKRKRKRKKLLARRIRICVNLFLIGIFFVSCYKFTASFIKNRLAQRDFRQLAEIVEASSDAASSTESQNAVQAVFAEDDTPEDTSGVLKKYRELYEMNSDLAGWIKIDETEINYPVMYTPGDTEYYLRRSFEKKDSVAGTPFIGYDCIPEPRSDNLIIYGHNMKDGSMFNALLSYSDEDFFREHPTIKFDTLYETGIYEVMAVFDLDVTVGNGHFAFYDFIDADSEEEYFSYINSCRDLSLYDTGVFPEAGDPIITLVTCGNSSLSDRFVVVAVKTSSPAAEI